MAGHEIRPRRQLPVEYLHLLGGLGACSEPQFPPTIVDAAPDNQALVGTVTPLLVAYAKSNSGYHAIDYSFAVCEYAGGGGPGCTASGTLDREVNTWRVPPGALEWGKQYWWEVTATDAGSGATRTQTQTFVTGVRQPAISSQLAARGVNGQEFHQLAGNYTTAFTDASVATAGPPLSVVRSYNSMDPRTNGIFGAGWSTRWDMKAEIETAAEVPTLLVTYPDGRQVRFAAKGDGTFQPPAGVSATLSVVPGGGWRLMDKSSTSYFFDAQGRLLKVVDNRGRTHLLTYGTDGKLARVTAGGGRALNFGWNGTHVATVSTDPVDGTALTWTYQYEGDKLLNVCSPVAAPNCVSYGYGTGSRYRSAVLDSDPNGYWRLGETTGTLAADLGWGAGPATYAGATLGRPGALAGTADTSADFTAGHLELPANTLPRLGDDLSVEAWIKTTQSGIVLAGGDELTEPVIYVGLDGRLRGQIEQMYAGEGEVANRPITSPSPVNDGQWHHAVLTVTSTLTTLYLDGQAVGTLAAGGQHSWRETAHVGIGRPWGGAYPSTPGQPGSALSFPFRGQIDEFAVYDKTLTAVEVQAHFAARAAVPHKLTKITLPSARVWAENTYDPATDRLKTHTDQHGGTWQVGAPVYDSATGMSTVTVTDPHNGTLTYRHDAWRGYRLVMETDQTTKSASYAYDV